MRKLIGLLLLVAVTAGAVYAAWRLQPQPVPRQADALDQYAYARATWLEPGFKLRGSERQKMLRQAVRGLQAVVEYFPETEAVVTRALAEYDTGLCYRAMGESERARDAFLRVRDYKRYRTLPKMHAAGRDSLQAIIDAAQQQLRELDGRT